MQSQSQNKFPFNHSFMSCSFQFHPKCDLLLKSRSRTYSNGIFHKVALCFTPMVGLVLFYFVATVLRYRKLRHIAFCPPHRHKHTDTPIYSFWLCVCVVYGFNFAYRRFLLIVYLFLWFFFRFNMFFAALILYRRLRCESLCVWETSSALNRKLSYFSMYNLSNKWVRGIRSGLCHCRWYFYLSLLLARSLCLHVFFVCMLV